jgi:hypothetical protein
VLSVLLTVAQSTTGIGDEVAAGSGAVAVVGFVIVGFAAVLGAYIFRKRKG